MTTTTFPPSTRSAVASTVHASKVYGTGATEVRALDDVTVEFPAGRFTAIMGPSGSGKSTLMHCVAGLDTLTSGQAFIGDVDLGSLSDRELTVLRRDHVGFVFQAFNLIPTLTAFENITLPLALAGKPRGRRSRADGRRSPSDRRRSRERPTVRADGEWVDAVIDTVGLRDRLSHRPSELSGGQQQRVAVARALATRPQIIFADEPTGNLDSRAGAEVLDFMRRAVSEYGQTIVMVTHDPVAASYADTAVFLNDGRVVDELDDPTQRTVLDRLKTLGGDAR